MWLGISWGLGGLCWVACELIMPMLIIHSYCPSAASLPGLTCALTCVVWGCEAEHNPANLWLSMYGEISESLPNSRHPVCQTVDVSLNVILIQAVLNMCYSRRNQVSGDVWLGRAEPLGPGRSRVGTHRANVDQPTPIACDMSLRIVRLCHTTRWTSEYVQMSKRLPR